MVNYIKRLYIGVFFVIFGLLTACTGGGGVDDNPTDVLPTPTVYPSNGNFMEQGSGTEAPEQNGEADYLFDVPLLSLGEVLDKLFDDFEAYIDYIVSVRGLQAYFFMLFRFEQLPGGRVADTPLANVIAMYEEMTETFEFVSLGSHHFLGYLGTYTNGAEFMHIPFGCSVEAEMNRWVADDGYGKSFYYTPLKAVILSTSAFNRFDEHIAIGRNLQPSDGRINRGEPVNALLGAAYKGIYELGDILTLYYISTAMDFQVVGFLNPGVDFWFGLGAHENVLLDYRIIMPQFVPDFEPVGEAEIWQMAFHIGELLTGFIAIEGPILDIREDTQSRYLAKVDEIAARHGLSDIIVVDMFPNGIIWPR